jgi:hypothetical protein
MKIYRIYAGLLAGLIVVLVFGGCENPASGNSGPSVRELADEFKAAQNTVLEKTTDTVTLGDEAAVDAALAAYDGLSDEVKAEVTTEKAKLDSLKQKIAELKAAAGPEELAEAFRTGHAAVLGKTLATITAGDETAVHAALEAYGALRDDAKPLLAGEKATLDSLKAKIEELKVFVPVHNIAGVPVAFSRNETIDLDDTAVTVTPPNATRKTIQWNVTADGGTGANISDGTLTVTGPGTLTMGAVIDGGGTGGSTYTQSFTMTVGAADSGTYYTAAGLRSYLQGKSATTPASPYPVAYTGHESPAALYAALVAAGTNKYVKLDLSGSSAGGFAAGTEAGRAQIVELTLPDSLTEIPNGTSTNPTFQGFTNLTTVRGAAVTAVGHWAFYLMANLTAIDLPEAVSLGLWTLKGTGLTSVSLSHVTTLADDAFRDCTSLGTVNLPEAINNGMSVFAGCTSLVTVNLPETIIIGRGMFYSCTSLTSIDIPKAEDIGISAFQNCTSLASINLSKVVSVGNGAFQGCASLTAINLPEAVSTGSLTFSGCTNLGSVSVPKAVTIGEMVFSGCTSLGTVSMPKAISISNNGFQSCSSLTTVIFGDIPPAIGLRLFQRMAQSAKTIVIKVPGDKLTAYQSAAITEGKTWGDVTNKPNSAAGYFWDDYASTKDNLTVNLESL